MPTVPSSSSPPTPAAGKAAAGVACLSSAFFTWGVAPVYWKQLQAVAPFEIILHRVVWSFLLLLPFMWGLRLWPELAGLFRQFRTLRVLLGSTVLLFVNWFIFVWAVNNGRILDTSLGYYINPLVNVLLGMLFLKERLRPLQGVAVFLAGCGVLLLTILYGRLPWVSLSLAFSFGFYGLLKKVVPVGAVVGLFTEMTILAIPCAFWLVVLHRQGQGAFLSMGGATDCFLAGTSLVTALPLLLFIMGARRVHLKTVGFLQYLAPSCTFLLAVFVFAEPLSTVSLTAFALIWGALGVYSFDSVRAG